MDMAVLMRIVAHACKQQRAHQNRHLTKTEKALSVLTFEKESRGLDRRVDKDEDRAE
jgi:hypothetical protein